MADDAVIQQYRVASDDMRFLSDQRFKIMTVYLAINAFLFNAATTQSSILLGLFGVVLAYLCLAWDARTMQWWGTLIESAKSLETRLNEDREKPVEVYLKYEKQAELKAHTYFGLQPPYPKASRSFFWIFNFLGAIWAVFLIGALARYVGLLTKAARCLGWSL